MSRHKVEDALHEALADYFGSITRAVNVYRADAVDALTAYQMIESERERFHRRRQEIIATLWVPHGPGLSEE